MAGKRSTALYRRLRMGMLVQTKVAQDASRGQESDRQGYRHMHAMQKEAWFRVPHEEPAHGHPQHAADLTSRIEDA